MIPITWISFRHQTPLKSEENKMTAQNVFVIGASAGGVVALKRLVGALSPDLPAAIFVVLHVRSDTESLLPRILNSSGPLKAAHAVDDQIIENSKIYIAPPDHHLVLEKDRVRLTRGPKENRHRPAVDVLFRSAARAYGEQVVGVVLTGFLDDGTAGLMSIKLRGGVAVIQDPADAQYPAMPRSALENVDVDYCMPLDEIGPLIVQLAGTPNGADEIKDQGMDESAKEEVEIKSVTNGANEMKVEEQLDAIGKPSHLSCPECGGILWEIEEGRLVRFRCHVGHAFSPASLAQDQSESIERALWGAVRALKEKAILNRNISDRARGRGDRATAASFEEYANESEEYSNSLRRLMQDK